MNYISECDAGQVIVWHSSPIYMKHKYIPNLAADGIENSHSCRY